ncbi:MAG: cyclodeaminase/cyclohydrolase family protein [Desulfamplus sp.]|nr:cyclodeaminase/cyclohydrolase family protein [Desulfamplus sp.]
MANQCRLETGIWGAFRNVCINMKDIEDKSFGETITKEAQEIAQRARLKSVEVLSRLNSINI